MLVILNPDVFLPGNGFAATKGDTLEKRTRKASFAHKTLLENI